MSGRNGTTICLLDDEPATLKAYSRLLASAGWRTATFTEPEEFLRHVEESAPRVVVIDMAMPRMHGLVVQERVRAVSVQTAALILTGNDDPNLRLAAMRAGAAGFFLKSGEPEEFLAAISRIFDEDLPQLS